MWTDTVEGHKLVKELSRMIVEEVAPEELDLFDELLLEYYQNPSESITTKTKADNPLGFGLFENITASTTVIAPIVKSALDYLLSETIKVSQEESASLVKEKIKTVFKRDQADAEELDPLTKAQLRKIYRLARARAIDAGLKPKKAATMARALVGSLSL